MNPSSSSTRQTFLPIQIIHIALGLGLGLFLSVIYFLSLQDASPGGQSVEFLQSFGYIAAALFLGGAILGPLLFRMQFRGKKINPGSPDNDEAIVQFLGTFMTAHIIRIALLDGPALFAAVTLFLYMTAAGTLRFEDPIVQVPTGVIGAYYVFWILWFPTRENILSSIRKQIAGSANGSLL